MINIIEKVNCCGCAACVQKCPKQCISLQEDNEGFLYPKVNTETCIDCGICEKVCPVLNPYEACEPHQVYAAINKDEKIRMESSSGGIFSLLAEPIIRDGGVVFGARFDEEWQVTLDYTENIEGLSAFRGSKYVQARTGNTYKQCEQFLKEGRKVLFTGSPCQIAGLHHYLRKEYENLVTCDFVCHGVPSPKVWRMYLKEVVEGGKRAISDIKFRNKDNGWKSFNFKLTYDEKNKKTILSSCHRDNLYMRAFLKDMILRPSCHNCKAKQGRSKSDITIADFWGIQKIYPEFDDDKGTGLIIIHSDKGKTSLAWSQIEYMEAQYDDASPFNNGLKPSMPAHPNRTKFFNKLDDTDNLAKLIIDCTKPSFRQRIRRIPVYVKFSIKRFVKSIFFRGQSSDNVEYPDSIKFENILSITFRDKNRGWKAYEMVIEID